MEDYMNELTTKVLIEIRDDARATQAAVKETNVRLDKMREEISAELGATNSRLDRLEARQVATETRLATELVAVVAAIHEVRDVIREDRADRKRLDRLERRVGALEKKIA
jgi:hypothetical protein